MSGIWLAGIFFITVMGAVLAAGYLLLHRTETRRTAGIPSGIEPGPDPGSSRAAFLDLFQFVGQNFPGAKNENNPSGRQLDAAGYRWPTALSIFYGIKCGGALFGAGLLATVTLVYRGETASTLLPTICGAAIGFMLPDRVLATRVRARARRLRSALPSALDLMVLGLEAGQSLDQSIADASRGLKRTNPDLSGELAQLYLELKASNSRVDSFRSFGTRNKEPELKKLASLLIDSDRFGSALAPALRSHSKYLRTRFRQQAQETARKVGVKLIFPVFFLIFPSVLLVTLGPACILMFTQLQKLMQ